MPYGIKISNTGYDVKTCDDEQLSYSSEFNNWKISNDSEISGEVTLTMAGHYNPIVHTDISHSLGYVPTCMLWAETTAGKIYLLPSAFTTSLGTAVVDTYIDSSKIRIYAWGENEAIKIKYKIFYDKIDE